MTAEFKRYIFLADRLEGGFAPANDKAYSEIRDQFLEAAKKAAGEDLRILDVSIPFAAYYECTDAGIEKLEKAGLSGNINKEKKYGTAP